jgi:hypothetical protein
MVGQLGHAHGQSCGQLADARWAVLDQPVENSESYRITEVA